MRWSGVTSAPMLLLSACVAMALAIPATGCSKAAKKKPKAAATARSAEAEADAADEAADEPADEAVADEAPEGVDPDTAINVDGGRIAVMSPEGWVRAKQSKDYLVKYLPGLKKTYPSIVVMGGDAPDGMTDVDGRSQREFVAAVAESLSATYTKNGKSTLVKKPAGLKLGPHFGVTWAAPATIKVAGVSESIDRTSYAVVIGGRMYTVEVRAPKGKLDATGLRAAKAVVAALAPADGSAPAAAPAASVEPPTDEPAASDAPAEPAAAQ